MKTNVGLKYIKWQDSQGLHEDTVHSISDIQFIKDELQFLRDLLTNYTLVLIHEKTLERAKKIAGELDAYELSAQQLHQDLKQHEHNLQKLLKKVEIAKQLTHYKNIHYQLMMRLINFYTDFRKTKERIFKVFTELLKQEKSRRLL